MLTSTDLLDILKIELRARKITYAELGKRLSLSEASVKRMFALARMPLERLDSICLVLELEVSDLVHRYEQSRHHLTRLTVDQERELVADPRRLLVAVSVKNHWTFEGLTREFTFSETECIQLLAHLDKIGLIELLPGNRIRPRFDENFQWIPGGPIETFFEKALVSEFLASDFNRPGRAALFLNGWMTDAAHCAIVGKVETLAKEYHAELARSCTHPLDQRKHVGLLGAVRPCAFSTFAPYL
jgi:DNA-binding Xre family transcriptional regulator